MGDPRPLLQLLLLLPGGVRPRGPLHFPRRPQPPPVQGTPAGPEQARQALQGEPQERVQKTQGLKLHHTHADRRCHGLPTHRNTSGRSYCEYSISPKDA